MRNIFVALICITIVSTGVQSKTITIPEDYSTIQQGIDASVWGDTVAVSDGVYAGPGNRDLSFFARRIVLRSKNGAESTIIDCGGSKEVNHRGFYFYSREDTNCVIDGFTIKNGYASMKGGAILIEDSSPIIKNCIFSNNFGHHGGVMYITFDASPVITDCVFENNSTGDVGIIHARFGSRAVFRDCIFRENTAKNGIFLCYNASPEIHNCLFEKNNTEFTGGAVFLQDDSSPLFNECVFYDNTSGDRGGAVFVEERGMHKQICRPVFRLCVFAGNLAAFGGGIYSAGPVEATFESCTFFGNSSPNGSVVFCTNNENKASSYSNCIVFDNKETAPFNGDSEGFNIRCTNITGNEFGDWTKNIGNWQAAEGNYSKDPMFIDVENYNFYLTPGSPCWHQSTPCETTTGALQYPPEDDN